MFPERCHYSAHLCQTEGPTCTHMHMQVTCTNMQEYHCTELQRTGSRCMVSARGVEGSHCITTDLLMQPMHVPRHSGYAHSECHTQCNSDSY